MAHDVFISHSSKDKVIADGICASLENRGVRCWIAPRDIAPGVNYAGQLLEAIENCSVFLVLLTDQANLSTHILKEVELAVQSGKSILPFKIEDVALSKDLKYYLSNVHWLDAITPPLERHFVELGDFILKLLDKPKRAAKLQENIESGEKQDMSKGVEKTKNKEVPSSQINKKKKLTLIAIVGILFITLVAAGIWFSTHPQIFFQTTIEPTMTQTMTNTPVPPTPTVTPSPTPTITATPVVSVFVGIPKDYTNCRETAVENATVVKVFSQSPFVYIHGMDETYQFYNVEYTNQDGTSSYCWVQKYQLDFPYGLPSLIPTVTPTPFTLRRTVSHNETYCFKKPTGFNGTLLKTFQNNEQLSLVGRDEYMEWFMVQVSSSNLATSYTCWIRWSDISDPAGLELLPITTP